MSNGTQPSGKTDPSVAVTAPTSFSPKTKRSTLVLVRIFSVIAVAEGALLPSILVVAVIHWLTGWGMTLVAIIGATHGTAFTIYMLLIPFMARSLGWSLKTSGMAFSVAFVPFMPWAFERKIRRSIASGSSLS
ncbi:MAG TPA: DUF3817 domain-containing protein [Candidatus Nanopelagicaceae bacterium]|nr:DUF3817 domain-containing protein [Candidatus Nanopelagicaceae bacterium]